LKTDGKKVINASNFKFSVKLSGDSCDLNVFHSEPRGATFARLEIDGKIIQDITIPTDIKEREFNIGNI
jgi:hypothetical protein